MPNIPFIQHNRSDGLVHRRRTNRTFESEDATAHKQEARRRRDRRKNKDRRHKQIKVLLDRRYRGMHRRKNPLAISDDASDAANLNATIGKHVNTTA